MADLEFYCNAHNKLMKNIGGVIKCPEESCSNQVSFHNGYYDTILNKVTNQWDNVFEKEKVSALKKLFDKIAYQIQPILINKHIINYIINNIPEDNKLVEMGCGEATSSFSLLKRKLYHVTLMDMNDVVINNLVYKLEKTPFKDYCNIVKADFYNKNVYFGDKYFDVSYNVGTIEHFDDPVKAVKEMKRIAKKVVCVVPAPSIFWKTVTRFREVIEVDASLWTEHTNYYTNTDLARIFHEAGLEVISTHTTRYLGVPFMNTIIGKNP